MQNNFKNKTPWKKTITHWKNATIKHFKHYTFEICYNETFQTFEKCYNETFQTKIFGNMQLPVTIDTKTKE